MDRRFDNGERWSQVLAPFADREVSILEVGSGVGGSAAAFLKLLPLSRITCVDTFAGNPLQEQHFDSNLALLGSRLEKIKSRSFPALDALAQTGRQFEVIYVDGSHARDDALVDSLLAWKLLKDSGVMIWDDYVWELGHLPTEERPMEAIDLFLNLYAEKLTIMERGYQVIVRKTANHQGEQTGFAEGFIFARTPRNLLRFLARRPMDRPHHGR
jgi:predicted O-methyltransferase YrrM